MTRYRSRSLKASVALWALVVLADAGWMATSGISALIATLAFVTVVAAVALVIRAVPGARQPVPIHVRSRMDRRGTVLR